jgi:DNA repair protein RadC
MIQIVSLRMVREKSVPYGDVRISKAEDVVRLWETIHAEGQPDREEVWLVCLDNGMKPTALHMVSRGSLDGALLTPREVFKTAFAANARFVILVHNHPSGDSSPSNDDRAITERIRKVGEILGIELRDHVIIGDGCFHSLAAHPSWQGGEYHEESESQVESVAGVGSAG